jgi:chromosome segregation ATPase
MRRDIENFGRSAETLAQAIAPDLTGKPAEDICSTLCQQLTEAESGQKTFEKAEHDIEENTAHRNKVQTQKNEAEARLAPHMERAKVDNIADLETAIGRSENLRLLNSAIEEATTVILELGDGLSLDNLEAEVADEDLTTIAARLDDVKEQSGAAMTLRDDCVLQKENAEAEKAKGLTQITPIWGYHGIYAQEST